MARVKYGTIVTEIRGKVGGLVFQKCGSQLSMRVNPSKKIPSTTDAFYTRNRFVVLAKAWAQMSPEQKLSFTTQAPTYPTIDKWGNPIVLTAYQLFIYINRTVQLVEGTVVTTAYPFYQFTSSTDGWQNASVSNETFEIIVVDEIPADFAVLIYVSKLLPANSYQVPDQVKFIYSLTDVMPDYYNIYASLVAHWGRVPVAGESFYINVISVNRYTGIINNEWDDIVSFGV